MKSSTVTKLGPVDFKAGGHKDPAPADMIVVAGTLVGIASGIRQGTFPNGDAYTAIKGMFEFSRYGSDEATIHAPILYAPAPVTMEIQDALEAAKATSGQVQFAFYVRLVGPEEVIEFEAANPHGDPATFDPLEAARKLVKRKKA